MTDLHVLTVRNAEFAASKFRAGLTINPSGNMMVVGCEVPEPQPGPAPHPFSKRATRRLKRLLYQSPRHSRVCSPTIDTILIGRPSVVASNWKSNAHTRFGLSKTGWTHYRGLATTLRHQQHRSRRPALVSRSQTGR